MSEGSHTEVEIGCFLLLTALCAVIVLGAALVGVIPLKNAVIRVMSLGAVILFMSSYSPSLWGIQVKYHDGS